MDLNLLLPDELEVECRVRNLRGSPSDVISQLENALKLEDGMPSLRPYKMHSTARKNPAHEIKKCSLKLSELKGKMEKLDRDHELDSQVLRCLETSFIHLINRLSRAQSSPKYGKLALGPLETSRTLLLKVQSVMQDASDLENTLDELKEIHLAEPEELSESEDDNEPPVFVYPVLRPPSYDAVNSTPVAQNAASSRTPETKSNNTELSRSTSPEGGFAELEPIEEIARFPREQKQQTQTNPNVQVNIDNNEPSNVNTRLVPPKKYISDTRSLARSGIPYDGSSGAIPIDLFVFQLETMAKSLNLSDELLFTEICFVLKGNALRYYWTYRRSNFNSTWSKFRNDLIERFKDRRTEFELRRLVESRKQHSREPFMNFYNDVWSLTLQCRKAYSDEDLIEILRLNMHPALQINLTDKHFENIQELIKSATAWESTWLRLGINPDHLIPNKRVINEIDFNGNPDSSNPENIQLSFANNLIHKDPGFNQNVSQLNTGRYNSIPSTSRVLDPNNMNICFNCDDIGHNFQICTLPRKRFCYKCGCKGVTVASCLKCSGNGYRDQMPTGDSSVPRMILKPPKIDSSDTQ